MKKIINKMFVIILIFIFLIFCSGGCGWMIYPNVRPTSQRNTIWISKDPAWIFIVSEEGLVTSWVIRNSMKIQVNLWFDFGTELFLTIPEFDDHDNYLFEGNCKYRKNDLTIVVEKDLIFDEKYKTITFYKLQGYSASDLDVLYELFGSEIGEYTID